MSDKVKYELEFPIQASPNMLYQYISSASSLTEWFADDVIVKNKTYTFFWDRFEQTAKLLKKKANQFVRYKWEENDSQEDYFEFLIQVDEITLDVALIITDFAEDEIEEKEQTDLWTKQVETLKRAIGS